MAKVRITSAPSGNKKVRITSAPGAQPPYFNQIVPGYQPDQMNSEEFSARRTIQEVPEDEANIEAEKGESIYLPDKGGLPAHYTIGGKKHYDGGTHLNVPKDSFVYSDTKKMRIKDPKILEQFGKSKGAYTPADLAKPYDINKFRKQLQDPDSDDIQRSTAEKMIANYNLKLGKLALVQESKKGFPQGIPAAAMPYMATYNIKPDQLLPLKAEQNFTQDIPYEEVPMAQYGGNLPTIPTASRTPTPPYDWTNPYYSEPWNPYTIPVDTSMTPAGYAWNYPAPVNKGNSDFVWPLPALPAQTDSTEGIEVELTDEEKAALGLRYGGTPMYQAGGQTAKAKLTPEQYAKLQALRKKAAANKPKGTTSAVSSKSSSDTWAYPGDRSNPSNKSSFGDMDWKEFRDKYYPSAKNAKELQYQIVTDPNHPEFAEEVKRLHNVHGPLKGNQSWNDGRLGHRWDALKAKVEETKLPPPEPAKTIDRTPIKPAAPQQYTHQRADAPFWLQDVINTASAAGTRLGLKKYLPWAPTYHPTIPRPTFYDPTRELASNAEQMAIGTEGAGMFAGPQAFNSRFAQIQGQGAKNAANILGRYHNQNVGEANRFEQLRSSIYNQAGQANANTAKQLYDQTTVANQQFDNAKRQANNELRASYVNALTNRGMTQTLNTLYPNYQIDPTTGGMLDFYQGDNINPTTQSTIDDQLAAIAEASSRYNLDPDVVAKAYGLGTTSSSRKMNDRDKFLRNYADVAHGFRKMGGSDEDNWLEHYRNAFPSKRR